MAAAVVDVDAFPVVVANFALGTRAPFRAEVLAVLFTQRNRPTGGGAVLNAFFVHFPWRTFDRACDPLTFDL